MNAIKTSLGVFIYQLPLKKKVDRLVQREQWDANGEKEMSQGFQTCLRNDLKHYIHRIYAQLLYAVVTIMESCTCITVRNSL